MTSRRAGAVAEMCGGAKLKRVKLSVNAAIPESRQDRQSTGSPAWVCMRDMNGGAQVRLPQSGWHNDEFVSLTDMSQSGPESDDSPDTEFSSRQYASRLANAISIRCSLYRRRSDFVPGFGPV